MVIDDHPLVARGIADFLQSYCGFQRAIAVNHSSELWRYMREDEPPQLFVVDFWLTCGASLALLEKLRLQYPDTPVLVISADDDAAVREKVRQAGASGFLNKQEQPEVFRLAVAAILRGEIWFDNHSPTGAESTQRELPITAQELGLTARQGQVLGLVLKGLPNKRIAQALTLSEQTVKEHITGILERIGARNRIEVITRLKGRRLE